MANLFNPAGRGTGIQGSINAVQDLFGGIREREVFDEQQAKQQQGRDLLSQANQGGIGSEAFKSLRGFDLDSANKLKSLLQTDDQGLDAAFQDAAVFKYLLQNDTSGQSALQFGTQRLQAGYQSGRNMIHTNRFMEEIQQDPNAALGSISSFLDIPNQIKDSGNNKKFEKQSQFEQLQELKKNGTPEQIREYRSLIGLDKPVKMSGTSEKALDKAQESAFSAGTAANKMDLLANDISKIDIGGGVQAGWSETFKNLLGSQDEVSNLRREFRSIRSSQAVRNLPPGVASDKDIALALSGFPREDAPASEIISFLKGQAKLARYEAAYNNFKSDYISTTKGISGFGKAWRKQLKDDDFVSSVLTVNNQEQQFKPNETVNQDAQALQWAQANPNDPRSAAILKKQGRL